MAWNKVDFPTLARPTYKLVVRIIAGNEFSPLGCCSVQFHSSSCSPGGPGESFLLGQPSWEASWDVFSSRNGRGDERLRLAEGSWQGRKVLQTWLRKAEDGRAEKRRGEEGCVGTELLRVGCWQPQLRFMAIVEDSATPQREDGISGYQEVERVKE